MSGIIIDVKANSGQANKDIEKLNKSLQQIEKTTSNMSSSLSKLAIGFGSLFSAAVTVNYLKDVTDAFTKMGNQISQVTGKTNDLIYAQTKLQNIAQRTLASNENTVTVFNKLGVALEKSGASLDDMLIATEAIQKAISLSNTSAEAANAAIIQLGQGLASGTLRGEELNSVLEQTPRVAKAIADGMGVTVGQLRKIAAEGQITSDAVFGALLSQSEKLNEEFANMKPLFSQAMTGLNSATRLWTREFLKGVGGGESLGSVIETTTAKILHSSETIASTMAVFVSRVREGFSVAKGLSGAVFNVLSSLGAQFFKALPSIELVRTLKDDIINIFSEISAPVKEVFSNISKVIGNALSDAFNWDTDVNKAIDKIKRIDFKFNINTFRQYQKAFNELASAISKNSDSIGSRFRRTINEVSYGFKSVLKYFGIIDSGVFTFKAGDLSSFISSITEILRGITGIKTSIFDLNTIISDNFGSAWAPLINFFNDVFSIAKDKLARTVEIVKDFADKVIHHFFVIYDEVIAHSWWTDLIDDVVGQAEDLHGRVREPFKKFQDFVIGTFRKMRESNFVKDLIDLGSAFKDKIEIPDLGKIFESKGSISKLIDSIKTEFPNALKTALLSISGLIVAFLFPAGVIKTALMGAILTGLATTGSLAAERFGNEMFGDSFITHIAYGVGKAIGFLTAEFIKSVPAILNAILGIANGFFQGFISEMPIFIGEISSAILGIADFAGVGGVTGLVGTVLFGVGAAKLLGNIDVVANASNGIKTIFNGIISFINGKEGLLSRALFGAFGAERMVAAIGMLASSLGIFDSIFAQSQIAKYAMNGGLLYVFLLGEEGWKNILNGLKLVGASVASLTKKSLASAAVGNKTAGMIYTLLFGNKSEKGVLKTSIEKYVSDTFNKFYDIAARVAVRFTSKALDIMSVLLFGTNPDLTKLAMALEFENLKLFLIDNIKSLRDFLLKSNVINTLWTDISKVMFKKKSVNYFDPANFIGPLKPFTGPIKPKDLQWVDTLFASLNARASALAGSSGLLSKIFFGKTGKLVIGAAILALFANIASASENAEGNMQQSTSVIDSMWDKLQRFVDENPLVTFSTIAVAAIGTIAAALAKLNGTNILSGAARAIGEVGTIASQGGVAGRRNAAYGKVAGVGLASAAGAYMERDSDPMQGALAGAMISSLVLSMPKIGDAVGKGLFAAIKVGFDRFVITPILTIMVRLGTGVLAAGSLFTAGVALLTGALTSLYYWLVKGINPIQQVQNAWEWFLAKFKLGDKFYRTTQFDDQNKLEDVGGKSFKIDTSKINDKLLSDTDIEGMNKFFERLKELNDRAKEAVLINGEIDSDLAAEIDSMLKKTQAYADKLSGKVRVSIQGIADDIIKGSTEVDFSRLGAGHKYLLIGEQWRKEMLYAFDKTANYFLNFFDEGTYRVNKKILEGAKDTTERYNAFLTSSLEELKPAATALSAVNLNNIPSEFKYRDSASGKRFSATSEDFQNAMINLDNARENLAVKKSAFGSLFNTAEDIKKVNEEIKRSVQLIADMGNAISSIQTRQAAVTAFQTRLKAVADIAAKAGVSIEENVLFSRNDSSLRKLQQIYAEIATLEEQLKTTASEAERTPIVIKIKTLREKATVEAEGKRKDVSRYDRLKSFADRVDLSVDKAKFEKLSETAQDMVLATMERAAARASQVIVDAAGKAAQNKDVQESIGLAKDMLTRSNSAFNLDFYGDPNNGQQMSQGTFNKRLDLLKRKSGLEAAYEQNPLDVNLANQINKINDQLNFTPVIRSWETVVGELNKIGIDFTQSEFFDLPANIRKELITSAAKVGRITEQQSKGMLPESTLKANAKEIDAAQKRAEEIKAQYQKFSLKDVLGRASSAGLSGDQFSLLKNTGLDELKQVGDMYANIERMLNDKSPFTPERAKLVVAEYDKLQEKLRAIAEASMSAKDHFDSINSELDTGLSTSDWISLSIATKDSLKGLAKEARSANELFKTGQIDFEEYLKRLKGLSTEAKAAIRDEKSPLSNALADLQAAGAGTSATNFLSLNQDAQKKLAEKAFVLNNLEEQIRKGAYKGEYEAAAYKLLESGRRELAEAVSRLDADKTPLERINAAGISLAQDAYNRLSDSTRNALKSFVGSDWLKEATALANDENTPENIRRAIQARIDFAMKTASKKIALESMKPEETQAYQAGLSFSSSIRENFTDGLKSLLSSDSTFGEFVTSIADNFTNMIINNFVDGMTSSLFAEDGLLNNLLKSIGVDMFKFGADLFGGNGEDNKAALDLAMMELTAALNANTLALGGSVSGDMSFNNILKDDETVETMETTTQTQTDKLLTGLERLGGGLLQGLGSLGGLFTKGFGGLIGLFTNLLGGIGGIGGGGGGGFGSLLGGLGSLFGGGGGLGSMFGEMFGLSGMGGFFSGLFFADGGPVYGPGTSISDSIPAMLSNGEFVVNAKSTGKYRGLLEAINSGRIPKFAQGGIVGEMANSYNTVQKSVATSSDKNKQQTVFNLNITGDVSRQTRTEIQRMIPQIATGVNSHNREIGYKGR